MAVTTANNKIYEAGTRTNLAAHCSGYLLIHSHLLKAHHLLISDKVTSLNNKQTSL